MIEADSTGRRCVCLSLDPIEISFLNWLLIEICDLERLRTDRWYDFLNIFAQKFGKKLAFWLKTKLIFKIDYNIGFWEKRHFFAENCQTSQKIVIITSVLGTKYKWTKVPWKPYQV
jgi:hypothetical protein